MTMMNKFIENWQKIADIQKEAMVSMLKEMTEKSKSSLDATELAKNMFSNPFEVFAAFAKGTEAAIKNSKEIMENNIKYHKAFIAYHEAMKDMMEAVAANAKIVTGEK